jgi:RNA recognition motif-containing protein
MKGKVNGKAGFAGTGLGVGLPPSYEGQRCDLFVGRLADSATEANVQELFTSVGLQIRSLKVPVDLNDHPKGYAFVSLADPSQTAYAIDLLNGRLVNGRPINVEPSAPNIAFKGDDRKGKGADHRWLMEGGSYRGPQRVPNGFGSGLAGFKGYVAAEREWTNGYAGKGKTSHQIPAWLNGEGDIDTLPHHQKGAKSGGAAAGGPKVPSNPNKLFVGNLTSEATSEDVWKALNPAGEIVGVRVLEGKFSGIAFVEYKDTASVEKAVNELQGVGIRGRPARLERQGGDSAAKSLVNGSVGPETQESLQDGVATGDQSAGPSIACNTQAEADNHDIAAGTSIARVKVVPPPAVAPVSPNSAAEPDAAGGAIAPSAEPLVEAAKPCKTELLVAEPRPLPVL